MFKNKLLGFVAFIAAGLFSLTIATAAPLSQVGKADSLLDALSVEQGVNKDVVKVHGCHSSKKWHMVYKWGYKAWHRHGYNCQPKKIIKKKWKHCHSGWKKHWHKGHGKHWHRHKGSNCHYKYKKSYNNNHNNHNNNSGCVKVGPVWVCSKY